MEEKLYNLDEAHRFFGVNFNNRIFKLAEKNNLNSEEKIEIVALAHASYLHWLSYSGHQKVNTQRALYMIAKAYVLIEDASNAMKYANQCLTYTKANIGDVKDFDIAYSHEIMARAAALENNETLFKQHYLMVKELMLTIENKEDLKWLEKDFNGGNWFGMLKLI